MDATIEFLNENAGRSFPLVQGSTALDSQGSFVLPNDVLLDARGFYRTSTVMAPELYAFSGATSSASGFFAPVAGSGAFIFRWGSVGNPQYMRIDVPASNVKWPLIVSSTLPDPNYPQSLIASITVTVGEGFAALDQSKAYIFNGTAPLEPGLMVPLAGRQVDEIECIPRTGDPFFVGGNIRVRGGYNFNVTQNNESLLLSPVV